jgi:GDP-4-dehydro-6-deoxy-D-mannose reductase
MQVLITGMGGFVGNHLAAILLKETNWSIIGISRDQRRVFSASSAERMRWVQADLQNAARVSDVLSQHQPDVIVHLAAQSHIPTAWQKPWETFENNVRGQLNLFQGVIAAKLAPRILIVSSNEVYGAPTLDELPIRESKVMRPNNPYAVSKATQDLMAIQYWMSHRMDVIVARPFNHTGPGQLPQFVVPGFAKQIAEIETGAQPPVMHLGNMAAERDFTDVRDIVRAYFMLIEKGVGGQIYNVCSGTPRSIQSILDSLFKLTPVKIAQETDPNKFRPADTPVSFGDNSHIRDAVGWQPIITFEQTLADILNEARNNVHTKT